MVADLRHEESDTEKVEAKRAAAGFPDSLLPTLSAFANTPGGGTVIFGLDESSGFTATGVYDAAACKATLASKARNAVTPPITFEVGQATISEVTCLSLQRVLTAEEVARRLVKSNHRFSQAVF